MLEIIVINLSNSYKYFCFNIINTIASRLSKLSALFLEKKSYVERGINCGQKSVPDCKTTISHPMMGRNQFKKRFVIKGAELDIRH